MKKFSIIALIFLTTSTAYSQHPTCDGNRYKNFVYSQIDSTIGVLFGHNYTINNVSTNLYMDIYEPNSDPVPKRPLIIYIHGGGFYQGTRQEGIGICSYFAYKGFVTATIDYRLIDNPQPTIDSIQVATGLVHAISDAKAAIRYFVEDAANTNNFKVDTNYIFVVGGSAGGVTASNLSYLDSIDNIPTYFLNIINNNGGFSGNSSSNLQHSTPVKGVINYSGALWRANWISPNEPPLFSVHETGDTMVNCNYGLSAAFNHPVYLYGSCMMHTQATSQGIYNSYYFINSNGHGNYFSTPIVVDTVLQRTSDFLYNIICSNITSVDDFSNTESTIKLFPNPTKERVYIELVKPIDDLLEIMDITGRVLYQHHINAQIIEIDVSNLSTGMYLLKLKNNPLSTTRLIIE